MRTAAKTTTYAVVHFAVAFTVAYALTGSWTAAAAIGLVEPFIQTGAYALHERIWEGSPKLGGELASFRVQNPPIV
ncbi:DUF2061 domain-containing protein [Parvularcula lutaonensis]|uniref:DUF2061 domain-containing protein n=1 Tax=Parvularcula lutaonensis TaxID=491923 RepID=A0ABV7MBV8_9PROT|nr:DUF2061 domain-containing protein [Parvularcula lutaonensis]GGY49177.1 hypothetical protein GCM10007148_17110 [Parvularcula lutaonensis]